MKKVLILTKTNWNEPPRIRHQITNLLKAKGYQITYVEKNTYRSILIRKRSEEGILFFSHAELIHHQLRYHKIIQWANNQVVKFYLKKIIRQVEFGFILNFCYDYSFIRQLEPEKRIITMIEDDFESQAKFGMKIQIRNQVRDTCKSSDVVLTVSYPLFTKLQSYKNNVHLFFPWSQKRYQYPVTSTNRNTVLYFGFVHRIDWAIVEDLVRYAKYNFRFIGPPGKMGDLKVLTHLKKTYQNFEHINYLSINGLKLDDVFCSILPYDPTIKSVQACTVSNRAFNLLSLGLPLVYASLDYLIEAPETVIRKNKTIQDYQNSLEFFNNHFYEVQGDIEQFLSNHYEEDRWIVLRKAIHDPIVNIDSDLSATFE
jgi:hypothetical protein